MGDVQKVIDNLEETCRQFMGGHGDIETLHEDTVNSYRIVDNPAVSRIIAQFIVVIEDARHHYHYERARAVIEHQIPRFLQRMRQFR